jgi:membrane-bound serine protease (ClpP class)
LGSLRDQNLISEEDYQRKRQEIVGKWGKTVNALSPINATAGRVFIEGEYWNATSDTPVEKGQPVQIIAVEGLMIKVKPET